MAVITCEVSYVGAEVIVCPAGAEVEVGESWSCQDILRGSKERKEAEEDEAG